MSRRLGIQLSLCVQPALVAPWLVSYIYTLRNLGVDKGFDQIPNNVESVTFGKWLSFCQRL